MFVVFEGIDGSGKTTISNRVAAELKEEGLTVKHLRAEGKFVSPVSEGIREFGRNAQNLDLSWQAEFLLYVARDVQLIHESLRPALAEHDLVLADRFLYTPEVLGRYGRRLPDSFARPILTAAADGLEPDLVILIDVDPTFARARRKLRKLTDQQAKPPSRKGLSGVGLQQRLRRGYLAMADQHPERWVVLENQDSLERSVARAVELIRQAHREGAARAIARFRAEATRPVATLKPLLSQAQALSAFLTVVDGVAEREPRVAAYLLGGMSGPQIDERRRALFERAPDAVLAALDGQADDESFRLRRAGAASLPGLALRSLGSALQTPKGWLLWQELRELSPVEALLCINGVDDERAWQARAEWLKHKLSRPELVLGTLTGLDGEAAWQLRDQLLAHRAADLSHSYELARTVAKSVTNLGSARAWELRRLTRKLAPVAALSSLGSLNDDESWQWRSESLLKAPKIVMGTLKGRFEPAAWQMRQQVAIDCKEALDGLRGVDEAPAWQLRDDSSDIWPSTVVKTLAGLADGNRGQGLVERLLRSYPENVSLLKHVSCIALGLHREPGASV
ncbi:MAG TPA: dTMP kinase [Polyangiaceae bacterium]|nr:dTMP kinase [Polyangiaceae bacterium]